MALSTLSVAARRGDEAVNAAGDMRLGDIKIRARRNTQHTQRGQQAQGAACEKMHAHPDKTHRCQLADIGLACPQHSTLRGEQKLPPAHGCQSGFVKGKSCAITTKAGFRISRAGPKYRR